MPAPDNVSYFSRFFLKFVEIIIRPALGYA
jgi:hypothetical protein